MTKLTFSIMEELFKKETNISTLADKLNISISRLSRITDQLEKKNLIKKQRTKKDVIIKPENNQITNNIKNLLIDRCPIIKHLENDNNIKILISILREEKSAIEINKCTDLNLLTIRRFIKDLLIRGLVTKHKKRYKLNEKTADNIINYIFSLVNNSIHSGKLLYKNNNLEIIESNQYLKLNPTGFSRYHDYNIKIGLINNYYTTKKELDKQDIFLHSLYSIKDVRTFMFIIAFYLNNKMNKKTLIENAIKLDKHNELIKIIRFIDDPDIEFYKINNLSVSRYEINEDLKMYDCQLKVNKKVKTTIERSLQRIK